MKQCSIVKKDRFILEKIICCRRGDAGKRRNQYAGERNGSHSWIPAEQSAREERAIGRVR